MSSVAPVCNISISTPPGQPIKTTALQTIPTNATTQQIINVMNNNIRTLNQQILNLQTLVNNGGTNFREDITLRRTIRTRIFDPTDHDVYVDVDQVTGITWVNAEGQRITWSQ